MPMDNPERRRRSGGRGGNARRTEVFRLDQMPWHVPVNMDHPTEPLLPEGVEAVHAAALFILSEIGVEFLNDEALALFKQAGCRVDGPNVRMDNDFVMEMLARAPRSFTITPRNPDRAVPIGGKHLAFVNVSSPPASWDMIRGKRNGDFQTFREFMMLTQAFNCIHVAGGYPVEPVDIHPSIRHLDCISEKLILTDKVVHAYSLGRERVEDAMEMVRLAAGLSHAEFDAAPRMYTNINSVSPLRHDFPMIDGALRLARRGQPVVVTPFTLAGAMAPVTLAGAVAQSIAEALCAIALIQYAAPGAPVAIGTFTSNVDMRSGAPAFGTPEYMRATQMTGQLARRYGLPLRSSGVCTANIPDAQAMWETCNSLWAAVQSGSNLVYHAAGWLEGGLIASPEKFVMDCEMLQMIQRYCDPILTETTPGALALDAIREVGPGGHFFGVQHTQDRYETAFYAPFVSDWRNFEAWERDGATDTITRAHKIYRNIVDSFVPPPMPDDRRAALMDFVERRKAEGGAPTDF